MSGSRLAHMAPQRALLVILFLTALVYWRGLAGGLILDDYTNLAPLEELNSGQWSALEFVRNNDSGPLGRPVAMLSFVVNYLLGGDTIFPLKVTNLAIHLICGALVFWVGGRLLAERPETRDACWWLALWAAALWLFSPLHVSTVLYVIQRMAQLAALFCLVGLLLYVLGRQAMEFSFRRGAGLIGTSVLLAWPLAVLSKENGILLPLLLFVTEAFWFRFRGSPRSRRFLKCLFAGILGLPALVALFVLAAHPERVLGGYAYRGFTLPERVLTEGRVLADYVRSLLYPQGARMGVFHDDFPLSHGLLLPPTTALAWVAWTGLLAVAIRMRATRAGLVLYGIAFFLAGHLIESTVLPLEPYFEHRNYLPGVGIYLAVAVAFGLLIRVLRGRLVAVIRLFMVLLPPLFAVSAHQRVLAWSSWESILLTTAQAHPLSVRVHENLANLYAQRGDLKAALWEADEIDRLNGRRGSATVLHRVIIYCWTGTPLDEEMYGMLEGVTALDPDHYSEFTLKFIADAADSGRCGEEVDYARLAANLKRWYSNTAGFGNKVHQRNVHLALARLLKLAGDVPASLAHLVDAMDALPGHLEAGLIMVRYQLEAGDRESARRLLTLLKQRDTGRVESHRRILNRYESLVSATRQTVTSPAPNIENSGN